MAEVDEFLKNRDDLIRVCPKCGSITLKQTPKPWEQKPGEAVRTECMLCSYKGVDFPVIKKTTVQLFRQKLKKK
ncbi:hypothetical protein HYX18_00110 [Candidatus Woesearchaeota archaeon]|nr:hypothetical protein [Candidatus Woesearchaeota archaeon]